MRAHFQLKLITIYDILICRHKLTHKVTHKLNIQGDAESHREINN